jgi:hypothetical protein
MHLWENLRRMARWFLTEENRRRTRIENARRCINSRCANGGRQWLAVASARQWQRWQRRDKRTALNSRRPAKRARAFVIVEWSRMIPASALHKLRCHAVLAGVDGEMAHVASRHRELNQQHHNDKKRKNEL